MDEENGKIRLENDQGSSSNSVKSDFSFGVNLGKLGFVLERERDRERDLNLKFDKAVHQKRSWKNKDVGLYVGRFGSHAQWATDEFKEWTVFSWRDV